MTTEELNKQYIGVITFLNVAAIYNASHKFCETFRNAKSKNCALVEEWGYVYI